MISVPIQGKSFNITVIQVYAQISIAEEAEILWRPTRTYRTNTQKSLEIPGLTSKFGLGVQNEAGQKLIEFPQENALVRANTLFQQNKRRLYTWTSPDGQYWNQTDNILWGLRWRSPIWSVKTRSGTDCGSDHEHLIAKFRLKLKKVGKTAKPFRYDLNQIPFGCRGPKNSKER